MRNHQLWPAPEELKEITGNPIDLIIRSFETDGGATVRLVYLRSLADPAPIIDLLSQIDNPNFSRDGFARAGEVITAVNGDWEEFIMANF